jgi:hypothetical protein
VTHLAKIPVKRQAPRSLTEYVTVIQNVSTKLAGVSSLQFAREGSSRGSDKFSKSIGADAIPAERDRGLLFKQIGSGDSDRVKFPVFCDESFDNIVRGAARVGIEYLNSCRFGLLRDYGPSTVENKNNIRSRQILIFRQDAG